jgi:hypothetical protein
MTFLRTAVLFLLSANFCLADGGTIIARQTINGLDLTVFAAPAPLRAGPVDVSVLLQDATTKKPVLDATVDVSWSSVSPASPDWMPPCCSMTPGPGGVPATRGHSQNKFLYSAIVPVRSAGNSEFVIRTKSTNGEATISCKIMAAPPRPPVTAYWPFLALPPFAVAAFTLHQSLTRRRPKR